MRCVQLVVALIAVCGFAAGASAQTTVTLSSGSHINADLTIQGGAYATTDFSTSPVLASKKSSESYTRRILMKFDTQNYIPAKAVIVKAELQLVLKQAESSESRPLTAYYVNRSFVKRETTWFNFRDGQSWSKPGGDLGSSFGTTYVGNAAGSTYKFDLTRMVQKAVNGEFGSSRYTRLALVDTGGSSDGNYKEFHSTRASSSSLRPRLVITYTTSTSTSGSTSTQTSPSTSTSTSGSTLRVMQWNVHKTKGSDGRCNPDRIATTIAKHNVHVVSINEVNFYSGECAWDFDMGQKLQSLLQQKTGATWYRKHVNVYGGTNGYGNVLLSRYKPVSTASTLLSYDRGVAQMTINVNGRNVSIFSTHVEYSNSSWRTTQTNQAVKWMSGFPEPRIMMGDFNTWPNTSDYNIVAKPYQDAWAGAKSAGTATSFNGTGNTHGGSRFDYVYHSRVSALSLTSVNVPDTRISGVYPSDHHPVIAVYRVN